MFDVKRFCIFILYNKIGYVGDYVFCLLESMQEICSEIIIVINGGVKETYLERLRQYSDHIRFRDNRGFDAEAYKETILSLYEKGDLCDCEELILCNDTFFGPFFAWSILFDQIGECDFWGLSKWLGGHCTDDESNFPDHVQGYFLVVRRRLLHSQEFYRFWYTMPQIKTYKQAVRDFEVRFTEYHVKRGFKYACWTDGYADKYLAENDVIYSSHPSELIRECRFPILKRKAIHPLNFEPIMSAIDYIECNYHYDVNMIKDYVTLMDSCGEKTYFGFREIEEFVDSHENVFVYGYWKWGKSIKTFFDYSGWKIKNMIDADAQKHDGFVVGLEDCVAGNNDGVIVALNKRYCNEAYECLKIKFGTSQILLPKL